MLRTSTSPTQTIPASGWTRRLKHRSSVVFPDPLSPTSATHAADGTVSVTSARATNVPKRFETPDAESDAAFEVVMRGRFTERHSPGSGLRAQKSAHFARLIRTRPYGYRG